MGKESGIYSLIIMIKNKSSGTGKYILVPHFLNANFIMYINHVIKHLMGRVYGVIWLSWHRFHWKWLLLKKKNDASLYRIKGNEI